jgi:hypothetical protein
MTAALAVGCTTAKNNNNFPPPPSGGNSGGGSTGTGGSSGPSGMVNITIDAPVNNPTFGAGSLMDVAATITISNGTDFVDGSSIKATVTAMGTNQSLASSPLVFSSGDQYTGKISLGALPTGAYTVTVTAASSGGAMATASADFQIDAGPTVIVNSPVADKHYKSMVVVEVVFDPGIFGPLQSYSVTVAGTPVTLTPVGATQPNTYRGSVDFHAPTPPLRGTQLVVATATDNMGRTTEVRLTFEVDEEGPVISMTTPTPEQLTGGVITISAQIIDGAGVLDSSVIAVISDNTSTPAFELHLQPLSPGVYGILFDTARLTKCPQPPPLPTANGTCILYPTLSFRASDTLGNESALGYNFRIDNEAPVSDLDPPMIRDRKPTGECSWRFFPHSPEKYANGVGPSYLGDPPHDGAVVPQVFDLRARVEDDGNAPPGTKEIPIAGIDPNATDVFVLDDTSQVLTVDTDGDGVCDDINPLLVPTTTPPTQNNQVLKIQLAATKPSGDANFFPDTSIAADPTLAGVCISGSDKNVPLGFCDYQLPIIISYAHLQPAIWGLSPIDNNWCFGSQFDTLANNIAGGWACIAVRSYDKLGNRGVSRVLRVYVTPDGTPPSGGIGTPPSCTGAYDRGSNTVVPGACSARDFKQPPGKTEICFQGDCNGPSGPAGIQLLP